MAVMEPQQEVDQLSSHPTDPYALPNHQVALDHPTSFQGFSDQPISQNNPTDLPNHTYVSTHSATSPFTTLQTTNTHSMVTRLT